MSRELALFNPAAMTVCDNPFVLPVAQRVLIGTPLWELAPATPSPLMLRLNGEWVLREHWSRPALQGDVIEWHILPMGGGGGGNGSRTIVTLIAMVVIMYFTAGAAAPEFASTLGVGVESMGMVGMGMAIAANVLINALIPIQQTGTGGTASPGTVYNVAASGNQARLNQPIPVIYGRMLTYPDYAAQPYSEFIENDQYFFAIYCIGHGSFNNESLLIDDTPLSHFQDVAYEIMAPGQSIPTNARFPGGRVPYANVVTAPEVSGQTMTTGARIGGYAACGPGLSASVIGIDIVFPQGLGLADSGGSFGNISASFSAEARSVDDFGVATSAWYALGTKTETAATNTPQRRSYQFTLATPGRVEVRVTRTDPINTSNLAAHMMVWAGLRAYLGAAAPLAATATHLALRLRASEQLSGLAQRKIGGIWRRKVRTWSSGGGWGALTETRNPMWARLDKLSDTTYGDGLPDDRIDLQTHADLAAVYDERQDHFDIVFDSRVTSIDADRTICMAGRAVPFQRAGVCTIARDQLQTLPVTAYTSRDIRPGSMTMGYSLATEMTADAVIVEYFSNRAWDWREVTCKAPGVVDPVNAVRQRIMGITGAKHAEREGLYLAAQNVYRRKFPKFITEMQGLFPAYGSAVMFAPALPGWGQAGDVAFWNLATLTMGVTEPLVFTAGASHFISLVRDDGSITPAIAATPGPTANDVVLETAPDFTMILDSANRERPKFIFGASGQHRIMVRVLGIRKQARSKDGAQNIEISTVAEDVRVHEVDNALLPGPGEIQDSVTPGTDVYGGGTGGGTATLINLESQYLQDGSSMSGGGISLAYTLQNDGLASWSGGLGGSGTWSNQWSLLGVIDPIEVAKYECRVTGSSVYTGSALGTWLSLSTTRTWNLPLDYGPYSIITDMLDMPLYVEIREVATGTVMASTTIHMMICGSGVGGGGPGGGAGGE